MFRSVPIFTLVLVAAAAFSGAGRAAQSSATLALTPQAYLPLVYTPEGCPVASGNAYVTDIAFQFDLDNPVRPAVLHADKNLALRGYTRNNDPGLLYDLVKYGSDDQVRPPQFATLFNPARVGPFLELYQVYAWNWASSPEPGYRGQPVANPPVTAMAVDSNPGEEIHVPSSGRDIGGGMEAIVLFADEDSVALRYTREDSSGSAGYTLHIDNICTDPNLLALYKTLDNPAGPRYVYVPPGQRPYGYPLPAVAAGQPIGTAHYGQIVVAISDTGTFQDPRSCYEWWQIRPGYGSDCRR